MLRLKLLEKDAGVEVYEIVLPGFDCRLMHRNFGSTLLTIRKSGRRDHSFKSYWDAYDLWPWAPDYSVRDQLLPFVQSYCRERDWDW